MQGINSKKIKLLTTKPNLISVNNQSIYLQDYLNSQQSSVGGGDRNEIKMHDGLSTMDNNNGRFILNPQSSFDATTHM